MQTMSHLHKTSRVAWVHSHLFVSLGVCVRISAPEITFIRKHVHIFLPCNPSWQVFLMMPRYKYVYFITVMIKSQDHLSSLSSQSWYHRSSVKVRKVSLSGRSP